MTLHATCLLTKKVISLYHTTRPFVEEEPVGIRVVDISRWPIARYTILKFERRVGRGGDAKAMVSAGQVLLNGKVETHTRNNLMAGDTIAFADEKNRIQLSPTRGEENHEVTGTPT